MHPKGPNRDKIDPIYFIFSDCLILSFKSFAIYELNKTLNILREALNTTAGLVMLGKDGQMVGVSEYTYISSLVFWIYYKQWHQICLAGSI